MTEQQKTDYLLKIKDLNNQQLLFEYLKCHEWVIFDDCDENEDKDYARVEKHLWCYDTCWNELELRLGDWLNE